MDYYGLYPKFKLNRTLNEDEKKYQLKQNETIDLNGERVVPDASVISINSSYLELVDKYYSSKGLAGLLSAFGFGACMFMLISIIVITIPDEGWISWDDFGFIFIFVLITVPMGLWMLYLLKTEWFAWTHYPVRFDRKNRLVHVHRTDGSTYSISWDNVFFTSGLGHRKDFNKDYYISGHVLADDNDTVIDTFCLPATHSNREQLNRHWEFVRRFMEDGPKAVIDVVDFCLPIEKRRESYTFGLLYLLSQFNGAPIFLLPLFFALSFIFSIPRYIAIVTSKRPIWPENIEALCVITANDPYCITAANNSKRPWRDIFKKTSTEDKK